MTDLGISLTLICFSLIGIGFGIGYWVTSKQFIKFYMMGMVDGVISYEKAQTNACQYANLSKEQIESLHKESRELIRRKAIEQGFYQNQD